MAAGFFAKGAGRQARRAYSRVSLGVGAMGRESKKVGLSNVDKMRRGKKRTLYGGAGIIGYNVVQRGRAPGGKSSGTTGLAPHSAGSTGLAPHSTGGMTMY